jgi:hypothetical protein
MDNREKLATIGHTRRRKTKQKHSKICVGHVHHYMKTNTNSVNKI